MGNPTLMNVLEDVDDFCDVEDLGLLCEFGDVVPDEVDEVPSLTKLENKVETLFILK